MQYSCIRWIVLPLDEVCAPGYTGRKRGETVRTLTTVLQAHTHQWAGMFTFA